MENHNGSEATVAARTRSQYLEVQITILYIRDPAQHGHPVAVNLLWSSREVVKVVITDWGAAAVFKIS